MIIHRLRLFDFGTLIVLLSMRLTLNSALAPKGRCVVLGPEVPDYQVQGEAVVIRFPFLEDLISYRNLDKKSSTFHVDHTNLKNQSSLKISRDRVVQSGRGVLLLPSHPSDSGTYTYIYRSEGILIGKHPNWILNMNEMWSYGNTMIYTPNPAETPEHAVLSDEFCLTGNISITIYKAVDPNMIMPYKAHAGEDAKMICPHLKHFRRKENLMWYKDFQSTALPVDRGQYTVERGIILAIKNISVKDEGFYTCRLNVIINNKRYNVSRTLRVRVSVPEPGTAAPEVVTSTNFNAFTSSRYTIPYIVFPVNGSFIESHLGSRLVIHCMVSIGSQSAHSTDVSWVINDRPVENSYLSGRAFQREKSITGNRLEVELVILELLLEDNGTELKCVCQNKDQKQEAVARIKLEDSESLWWVIAAISCCFILMVCVFLYHLCRKPQKRGNYVQARQNSSI